ncbi:hypothetical protein [Aquipuribacter hungaricus]|uniref:Uncharacterized protein n=1 Tax=Aquipuribacter hungaricus TaxID=545624 RepID=A0ABV7WF32_9MICO
MAEVARLVERQRALDAEKDRERARAIAAEEELERVQDRAAALDAELASYSGVEQERLVLVGRLEAAQSSIVRLQQENEIRERHQVILDETAGELAVEQARGYTLTPLLAETFARLYAVAIGLAGTSSDFKAQLDGIDGGLAPDALELVKTAREAAASMEDMTSEVIELFDGLGVPEHHVVDGEGSAADLKRHMAAYKSLIRTKAYADEVSRLDDESQQMISALQSLGARWLNFAKRRKWLQQQIDEFVRIRNGRNVVVPGNQFSGSDELLRPGDVWPYLRGEDVWVLSTLRKKICRPRGREGTLGDRVGPKREAELVESFLRIRPEGGRLWIDADGDVCTRIGSSDIYLGRVDDASKAPLPIKVPA